MATKIKDPEALTSTVVEPFKDLYDSVVSKHKKQLVSQWVRQDLTPAVEAWEAANPELFRAIVEQPSRFSNVSMSLITVENETYTLPTTRKWPNRLPMNMVTLKELVSKFASDETKSEMEGALKLREKADRLAELFGSFIEGFTSMEQAIFSLPELKNFAPVKASSQKRPRFIKLPSNELRQLMMEAARLKEAFDEK